MKNINLTDEQLDSVIEYLEGNTHSLEDALQEVLNMTLEELSHEDYKKYLSYDIVQCSYCYEWCKVEDIYFHEYYSDACEECTKYLKDSDEEY